MENVEDKKSIIPSKRAVKAADKPCGFPFEKWIVLSGASLGKKLELS
jgi:hypothetical protein